ncbi:hypothetical protein N1851_000165 [Merluccius polli]|uniref:Uncharacterized protein n=1 Tax=Merluccius polli TaxID=89951 RepID=A0AA47P9Y0_MERPO|nr:hypothetical protein N1851_000165 [Merluccius polli]
MNGFASLMDLEDSNCVFVINEGLDTSFSEISGEKMHIQPTIEPVMEQEMSEVLEKATSRPRTRGKKRLALLKNLSSRISLVPDDDQQQQAPKDDAEKATEHPEKIQHKQKKSVEKVSQWLLQVPLTENLESEVNHDVASDPEHPPASPAGSCSSASTTIIRQAKPREVNKKTEHIKSLEYQVFGVVYSRRGKRSFSPPQHPVEPFSHDPSLVDGEHNPMADIGESSEPIPDDYTPKSNSADDGAKGVVEIQPHMTNEQSSDTGKKELRALDRNADVNEIRKDRERSEKPWPQEEREASSLVINTVVLQLDNVMQDVDTDLQKQTTEKQETVAKTRPGRRKGKNAKLQNRKSVRGRKQLVLVSALEGEAISKIPKSRRECGEVQVQIETYPSSEEVSATVARTPRSRRPQHIAEEVQESSAGKRLNKRAISTRGPTPKVPGPDNHNMAKLSEEARTIISDAVNQMVVNVTKSNGCICGEDIGGIEKIESVEGSMTNFSVTEDMTPINGSIVEVPNTISPCEASAACFVPTATTRSPTAAALPSPAPESIGPADQKRALIEDSASQIECAEMEVGEDRSDSEVDTEQLMKSFKAAKRKSFHLGSPKGKRSIVSLDKRSLNSKMEDNCNSGTERPTNQILNAAEELATVRSKKPPEIERSSCGDLVASSNSPSRHRSLSGVTSRRGLRRRLVQSEKVLKLDSTILINSQDSAVGCVSGNTVYSALSPNKVAKSQTQSLHCSVAPDTSDSVLLFSALEVSEDGPPNTRICMSSDTLSVNRQGNTDNSVELVVNTNGSTTPDGLVPPVVESADKVPASGGRLSASSPIKKSTTRKRMVQWSSSESSEEELPSLAQIFKSRRRPPAVQCNRLEGQAETPKVPGRVSESEEPSILAGPVTIQPVCAPSPDFVESSQTSVDLFDTPTECDIAAIDTGISMDSSQFSSDLLVTQQKLAMQQELLRLGNLMALVTEVLQEKEDGTTSELPADGLSTGHALPMSCDQEVRQTARGEVCGEDRRIISLMNPQSASASEEDEKNPAKSLAAAASYVI